jgi:hypothetical protein
MAAKPRRHQPAPEPVFEVETDHQAAPVDPASLDQAVADLLLALVASEKPTAPAQAGASDNAPSTRT